MKKLAFLFLVLSHSAFAIRCPPGTVRQKEIGKEYCLKLAANGHAVRHGPYYAGSFKDRGLRSHQEFLGSLFFSLDLENEVDKNMFVNFEMNYSNGKLHGDAIIRSPDRRHVYVQGKYKNGLRHGPFIVRNQFGHVQFSGSFREGIEHGTFSTFSNNGQREIQRVAINGKDVAHMDHVKKVLECYSEDTFSFQISCDENFIIDNVSTTVPQENLLSSAFQEALETLKGTSIRDSRESPKANCDRVRNNVLGQLKNICIAKFNDLQQACSTELMSSCNNKISELQDEFSALLTEYWEPFNYLINGKKMNNVSAEILQLQKQKLVTIKFTKNGPVCEQIGTNHHIMNDARNAFSKLEEQQNALQEIEASIGTQVQSQ